MRSRSITGPVLLVIIGFIFLVNNIWRDIPFWSLAWDYWPVLLIVIGVIGLFEALYHASRGVPNPPRPMAGAGIFWLVMLVAFFSWAGNHNNMHIGPFANGGFSNMLGTDYSYPVNATGASQGVSRVVLDGLRGNMTIKGQDGGDVKVSGKRSVKAFSRTDADRANDQSPVRIDRQGDLLIIRAEEPKNTRMLSVSADLDITIPKGIDVETRGRNGDLTIDDISGEVAVGRGRGDVRLSNIGNDVKIESTHGNLTRAKDVKGKVDLKGNGDDVDLENIAGEVTVNGEYSGTLEFQKLLKSLRFQSQRSDFRAEAVPGSITLDLSTLKMTNVTGPVRYTTRSRDIETTDITNSLEISIDHGDIQVTQTKPTLPKMDIHAHTGNVTLAIPEKAAFDLDVKTGQGEATNDFGDPLKAEPDGRAATIKGKQGSGPEIKIGTDRGALTVKKS